MKLATCAQMRALDQAAIDEYAVPGLVLMENAARSVFDICRGLAAYAAKKAVIVCGTGNNGGDGFALARHMHNDGVDVLVVVVGSADRIAGDARVNYTICKQSAIDICIWENAGVLAGYPLIVDAMLGTGVSGALRPPIRDAVSAINDSSAYVVAIDCPTGGDPDTGCVPDCCVRADLTVTLAMPKPGLLLYPLAGYAGRLETGAISAPRTLLDTFETNLYAVDTRMACGLLPKRHAFSHKGTYGKVTVAAGSKGMTGAAAFCAEAAYRSGCGYVVVCAPASAVPVIQQLAPQAVTTLLPEKDGLVCAAACDPALEQINQSMVCLIGPGLGRTREVAAFVGEIIAHAAVPLILDADALYAITPDLLRTAAVVPVITPHPLELSRLTGRPVDAILDNMPGAARAFAAEYNTVTVLKAASTVIAEPGGMLYLYHGACSALAKAGSGDVLAGLIAGFTAQGLSGAKAAALGVFVHGQAGKAAAARCGEYSVGCDDILTCLPEVFRELSEPPFKNICKL